MLSLWEFFWNWPVPAPPPLPPPPIAAAEALRRILLEPDMQRIALGFQDPDPQRARLHREVVARINEIVGHEVTVTTPTTPNTDFLVQHPDMDHVPTEGAIIMQTSAGVLYASSPGTWTRSVSKWRYSGTGKITIRLR